MHTPWTELALYSHSFFFPSFNVCQIERVTSRPRCYQPTAPGPRQAVYCYTPSPCTTKRSYLIPENKSVSVVFISHCPLFWWSGCSSMDTKIQGASYSRTLEAKLLFTMNGVTSKKGESNSTVRTNYVHDNYWGVCEPVCMKSPWINNSRPNRQPRSFNKCPSFVTLRPASR